MFLWVKAKVAYSYITISLLFWKMWGSSYGSCTLKQREELLNPASLEPISLIQDCFTQLLFKLSFCCVGRKVVIEASRKLLEGQSSRTSPLQLFSFSKRCLHTFAMQCLAMAFLKMARLLRFWSYTTAFPGLVAKEGLLPLLTFTSGPATEKPQRHAARGIKECSQFNSLEDTAAQTRKIEKRLPKNKLKTNPKKPTPLILVIKDYLWPIVFSLWFFALVPESKKA